MAREANKIFSRPAYQAVNCRFCLDKAAEQNLGAANCSFLRVTFRLLPKLITFKHPIFS